MENSEELLRRVVAGDEQSLRAILTPTPELGDGEGRSELTAAAIAALGRHTRNLVRLAALLVLGACTDSVRWAVDLACANGASEEALAAVLVSTAADAGEVRLVWSAARLATALGIDVDVEGWDGT
jgi:alkylhydroperoxidase/carboxymuconolactone decarboxylase family protein YurZ